MAGMFERELAAIARKQHGLILYDQALTAGITRRMLDGRVARGELVRVTRRLFRVAAIPVTFEQRALGPCLLAGSGAMASHLTAAALHGLSGVRSGRIEIAVPRVRAHDSCLAVVHQTIHPVAAVRRRGIPVTPVSRCLVDIASRLSEAALAEALDDAFIRRMSSREEVDAAAVAASWGQARIGLPRLRAVLEVWTPGPRPGSVAEMRLARLIVAAGFPVPDRQVEIRDRSGRFVARGDLGYSALRVVIEYYGKGFHGPRRVPHDERRANAIAAAGWTMLTANAATFGPDRQAFISALGAVVRGRAA